MQYFRVENKKVVLDQTAKNAAHVCASQYDLDGKIVVTNGVNGEESRFTVVRSHRRACSVVPIGDPNLKHLVAPLKWRI